MRCTVCRYAGSHCVRHNRKRDHSHFGPDSAWRGKAKASPNPQDRGHYRCDEETLRCIQAESRSRTLVKVSGLSQPILLQTPFVKLRWHDVEPQCATLAVLTRSLQRANSAHDKRAVSRCRDELQRFWHHAPGGHHLRQCGADVVGYKAFGPGRWSFLTTSLNNKQPLWVWEEDGAKTRGQGNLANEVQGVQTAATHFAP